MELNNTTNSLYDEYIKLQDDIKNHVSVKELVRKHMFKNENTTFIYSDLIICLNDFVRNSKSFQLILNAFNQEVKAHEIKEPISEDIKRKALNLINSLNENAHSLKFQLVKVFQIDDLNNLNGLIEEWRKKGYYTSACSLVIHLNIRSIEYLRNIVFPLIPKCMDSVYNFVNDDQQFQIELLRHLDLLYKKKRSTYSNVLRKVIKKYDLPLKECPEFRIGSCKKNLNFINSLAKKNNISFEAWKEMVFLRVQDDQILKNYILHNLEGWHLESLADEMTKVFSLHSNSCYEIDIAAWPTFSSQDYLTIDETINPILFIDNVDKLKRALDKMSSKKNVGIDCEWRPELLSDTPLSILQIATKEEIFLFDMIALKNCSTGEEFAEIVSVIFLKEECLKLGYAIDTDVQKIFEYFPTKDSTDLNNVLDLKLFYDFLKISIPNFVENSRHSFKGLSQLSFEVLGKSLDKREQYSDWENRPLRKNQIEYSALDAFCLIKIYEELKNKINKLSNYNFDDLKASFDSGEYKNLISNVEDIPTTLSNIPNNNEPIRITKIKFLVDKMLFGLGRHLRILGADCAIMEKERQEEALDLFGADRIILSTGSSYKKFVKLVSRENVFYIQHNLNVYEQIKAVWEFYKIIIKQKDIFSRCIICNSNTHIHIPGGDVNAMIRKEKLDPAVRKYGHMKVDMNTAICENNTKLRMDLFYNREQKYVKMFDVCVECGMINWKGSHHKKVKEKYESFCVDSDLKEETISCKLTSTDADANIDELVKLDENDTDCSD